MLQTHYVNATHPENARRRQSARQLRPHRRERGDRRARHRVRHQPEHSRSARAKWASTFETTCRFAAKARSPSSAPTGTFTAAGGASPCRSSIQRRGRRLRTLLREHAVGRAALRQEPRRRRVPAQGGIRYTCEFASGPTTAAIPTTTAASPSAARWSFKSIATRSSTTTRANEHGRQLLLKSSRWPPCWRPTRDARLQGCGGPRCTAQATTVAPQSTPRRRSRGEHRRARPGSVRSTSAGWSPGRRSSSFPPSSRKNRCRFACWPMATLCTSGTLRKAGMWCSSRRKVENTHEQHRDAQVRMRRPGGIIVAEESRTVAMVPVPGEPGRMQPDIRSRSQVAHVPLCPDYDVDDIVGQPLDVDVEVTALYTDPPVSGKTTMRFTPSCDALDAGDQPLCRCECTGQLRARTVRARRGLARAGP